jgi:hypothetical protein
MYYYLLNYTDANTNPTKRTALTAAFAAMGGMTLAPAIMVYSSLDPIIVPAAFALSCLTFAGATGGALMAPRGSMLKFAPVLGGSMLMLLGTQVVGVRCQALCTANRPDAACVTRSCFHADRLRPHTSAHPSACTHRCFGPTRSSTAFRCTGDCCSSPRTLHTTRRSLSPGNALHIAVQRNISTHVLPPHPSGGCRID